MHRNRFSLRILSSAAVFGWALFSAVPAPANQTSESATAIRVIRPMAEAGDNFAQYTLGLMYGRGWNVPQDLVQALKWLTLASSRAVPGPERDVAMLARADVSAKVSPAQRDEAQKLAQDWFDDLVRRNASR